MYFIPLDYLKYETVINNVPFPPFDYDAKKTINYFSNTECYPFGFRALSSAVSELIELVQETCNNYLAENNIPVSLTQIAKERGSPWYMKYSNGGYCLPHKHDGHGALYTAILPFDHFDEDVFFAKTENGTVYSGDTPGIVKLFRSDCYEHGIYPVQRERRIVVMDFNVVTPTGVEPVSPP